MHRRLGKVVHAEGSALMRHLDETRRQTFRPEEMSCLIQLFFRQNPEADGLTLMRLALVLDDQAVVARLFQATEVEGIGVAVAQDQTHDLFVKGTARLQIARRDDDVARSRDVEGRVVNGLWQWHGGSPYVCSESRERGLVTEVEGASQPTSHVVPSDIEQERQTLLRA